jgi:hypothetical protein
MRMMGRNSLFVPLKGPAKNSMPRTTTSPEHLPELPLHHPQKPQKFDNIHKAGRESGPASWRCCKSWSSIHVVLSQKDTFTATT